MLKKVPKIISPELIKILMEMGHSDIIILADANYPAASNAQRLITAEGVEIPDLLKALLEFFPLDNFITNPVQLMKPRASEPRPDIWDEYASILSSSEEKESFSGFAFVDRLDFYEASKKAYVIIQTGTTARYANIMLQKGVV